MHIPVGHSVSVHVSWVQVMAPGSLSSELVKLAQSNPVHVVGSVVQHSTSVHVSRAQVMASGLLSSELVKLAQSNPVHVGRGGVDSPPPPPPPPPPVTGVTGTGVTAAPPPPPPPVAGVPGTVQHAVSEHPLLGQEMVSGMACSELVKALQSNPMHVCDGVVVVLDAPPTTTPPLEQEEPSPPHTPH